MSAETSERIPIATNDNDLHALTTAVLDQTPIAATEGSAHLEGIIANTSYVCLETHQMVEKHCKILHSLTVAELEVKNLN